MSYSGLEGQAPYLDASRAHVLETTLEMKAGRVPSGDYAIPAVLNYQAIDEQGNIVHESLTFTIRVKVHDPSQPTSAQASYARDRPGVGRALVTTGEVMLVVVLWPVWVLKCLIVGGCSNC